MAILKPIALLAEPVVDRHAAILEDHGARRLGVPAHLALVGAELEAGRPALDQKGRDAARAVVAGARHHDVEVVLVAGAGDELLLPVEHVMIAVARPRACASAAASEPAPGSVRQ